jgi:hypothetical protein
MSDPGIRPMKVAEFLRWEHGTDTRCELVDGVEIAVGTEP